VLSPLALLTRRYSLALRSLRAFPVTETELKFIAAAAKTGLSRMPEKR
jgi:hypothetical protein